MHIKTIFTILVVAMVSACSGMVDGITKTSVGRQMSNSHSITPELKLVDAVFFLTKNQTREQAIKTLQDDGATCNASTCIWSFVKRETWVDTLGVREPSPKRTIEWTWSVTIRDEKVVNRTTIVPQVTATDIE